MKKRLLRMMLIAWLGTWAMAARGQIFNADSLRGALRSGVDDTSYARTAYFLARTCFQQGEPDSVQYYATLGAERLGRSVDTGERGVFWSMQLWRVRGMGWFSASRFDSAIVAFQRMYQLAEALDITKDMGAALSYQGFALREMDDQRGALGLVRQAITVLSALPPGPDMANCYNELGIIHGNLGAIDSAVFWYSKAAVLYTEQGNDHHLLNTLVNMGEVYFDAGRWSAADSVQGLTYPLRDQLNDPATYNRWLVCEVRMRLRKEQVSGVLPLLDSAMTMARDMGDLNAQHHLLQLRSMVHTRTGNVDQAYLDQHAAQAARMADMDLEKVRATEQARVAFAHEKAQALAEARVKRERMQKWAAVAIGMLAVALAFVWYRSARAKSRAAQVLSRKNEEIQRAQDELVRSEKQREAEQVRTRIARDIHDDIGATLTKIALLSGVAVQKTRDPEEMHRTFTRISEHTRNVSRALSDVVWAVDPQRDTRQGMLEHVRDLSQRLLGDNGIRFELDLHAEQPDAPIAPALKRDLHLVLNECFNNILKYAHAHLVRVRFHLSNASFELRVDDDGTGFDPALVPGRGNGLKNMQARIAQHGGALTITSAPGRGTGLQASGPLT